MAEARRQGIGRVCLGRHRVEPLPELTSQDGGEARQHRLRLLELGQLVVDSALPSQPDARAVEPGRHGRGLVDRVFQRRHPERIAAAEAFLEEREDAGHAGDGLQQDEAHRFEESQWPRDRERPGPPPLEPLVQLRQGGHGQGAAIVPGDLAEHSHRLSVAFALERVAEHTVVLARIVHDVHATANGSERSPVPAGERAPQDFEHCVRVRRGHERGQIPVDREQRDGHGERLHQGGRRRERGHFGPAAHRVGERAQASLEVEPRRACARKQARACERRHGRPAGAVANLERVAHDTTVVRHVDGLSSHAARDHVSVAVFPQQGSLQVALHEHLIERGVHAGQLVPERRASTRVDRVEERAHRGSVLRSAGETGSSRSAKRLA